MRAATAEDAATGPTAGILESEYRRWDEALRAATAVAERVAAGGGSTLEERRTMALAAAVQLVRTHTLRVAIVDAVSEELTANCMEYLRETKPDLAERLGSKYRLTPINEVVPSLVHAIAVWRTGLVTRIATTLLLLCQ